MMRLFLSIIVITILGCSESQPIEKQSSIIKNLKTNEDVEMLIQRLATRDGHGILFNKKNAKQSNDSLQYIPYFYKEDFDNNGFVDLLINGYPNLDYSSNHPITVVMNFGGDSLHCFPLMPPYMDNSVAYIPTIEKVNGETIINLEPKLDPKNRIQLINKFEYFIEYNPDPEKHFIDKIEYSILFLYDSSSYDLSIDSSQNIFYTITEDSLKGDEYKSVTFDFEGKIEQKEYQALIEYLNYIDFPQINNHYNTDNFSTSTITITYSNGRIKKIKDNNLFGTNDLAILHRKLLDLRFSQD